MPVCMCLMQSSPVLVLDSGTYIVMADAYCPDSMQTALPVEVTLLSQKAYFILVSGQPPRAKLVSNLSRHCCSNSAFLLHMLLKN